jgi:hypothetical protein
VNAALQRLRAEIAFDREAFARRIGELEALTLAPGCDGAAQRAQAAVALHHAYGSIEGIMVRVARYLEGDVPQGADWHQTLLHSMGLEIEGVRPAIFSAGAVVVLRHLLGFRHFFRHAYAVELDVERLTGLMRELVGAGPRILAELTALDRFLEEAARED